MAAAVVSLAAWKARRAVTGTLVIRSAAARWPNRWRNSTLIAAEEMAELFEDESEENCGLLLDTLQVELRSAPAKKARG
jgi:hypothetical protein